MCPPVLIAAAALENRKYRTLVEGAAAGFVAVDLYDGCFIYDFDRHEMRVIDLDELEGRTRGHRQGQRATHQEHDGHHRQQRQGQQLGPAIPPRHIEQGPHTGDAPSRKAPCAGDSGDPPRAQQAHAGPRSQQGHARRHRSWGSAWSSMRHIHSAQPRLGISSIG